jgi:hypothetical protein
MSNKLYEISKPYLIEGYSSIINDMKILLYKRDENIFEILDFENDEIYKDPLLFAFFYNKIKFKQSLDSLILGYTSKKNSGEVISDEYGRIYIPNIGWFLTDYKNQSFVFDKVESKLLKNNEDIKFVFERIEFINNTNIEILKYQIPLLKSFYFNTDGAFLDVEIENITKKHLKTITNAYNLIKKNIPSHFELIEKYAPKCVIFNFDTYERNSFAALLAYGIGFYNAYQDDYDEVFFIDDIAHQTGHIIFDTMIFKDQKYLKVKKETIIETLEMPDGTFVEKRDLHIIFHALYTYYTSFICLDKCIDNGEFNNKQLHEAMGRISFYINKCYKDLLLIDSPIKSFEKANHFFTNDGMIIYTELKNKWFEMYNKWFEKIKHFDMSNQPYNFTYSKFLELNPLNN